MSLRKLLGLLFVITHSTRGNGRGRSNILTQRGMEREEETFESIRGRQKGQMLRVKAKTQRRMVLDLDTRWRRGKRSGWEGSGMFPEV